MPAPVAQVVKDPHKSRDECRVIANQPVTIMRAYGPHDRKSATICSLWDARFQVAVAAGFEEQRPSKPQIRVRFPSGVLSRSSVKESLVASSGKRKRDHIPHGFTGSQQHEQTINVKLNAGCRTQAVFEQIQLTLTIG